MSAGRDPYLGRRYDRRGFLARAGGTLAVTGGLGTVLAACGGGDDGGTEAGAEDPDYGTAKRPLGFHHDAAVGPLFAPYIDYFNAELQAAQAGTSYVAQDYFAVTSQQLAGGSVDYDVLFADEGYLETGTKNGWVRALEEFPASTSCREHRTRASRTSLKGPDGELYALPYFQGAELFVSTATT